MKLVTKMYVLIFPVIIGFSSCKKFVDVDASPNYIVTEAVFASDKTAISAISGLYLQMRNQLLSVSNGGLSVYSALSADEIYNTNPSTTADPFYKNSIPSTNNTVSTNFWGSAYRNIYQVNAMLEGLSGSVSLTDSVRQQLKGEVRLVRAFYYFYLVNLLVLSTNYDANSKIARSTSGEILQQIVNDLKAAEEELSIHYPSTNRGRPNRATAAALLARVYLYNKDWVNAEIKASAVINAGNYSLVSNLNNVFVPNSNEIIWQIIRDNANTAEGSTFIPASATAKPVYAITTSLLNSFEAGDQRKLNWLKSNTVSGQAYYYPFKYKVRVTTPVSEYEVVFRLGELWLVRAEARAMQNNSVGAKDDLNMIRNRSGLLAISANTQTEILNGIEQERRVELFTEWGHRWLDLKRKNKADGVLGPIKAPNWQPTDILYPIPQVELDRNPFLVQNPGY